MLSKNQRRRMRRALLKTGIDRAGATALNSLHLGRSLGTAAGALGGASGSALGATVGNMVDRAVSKKLSGSGNYMVGRGNYVHPGIPSVVKRYKGSSTMSGGNGSARQPHFSSTTRNAETGEITIARREFISSVNATGSEAFSTTSYSVNPGLLSVFKWLSQLAANYTEYHMVQLVFTFESVISPMSVSAVGSLGTIVLAANYNAGSEKFASFIQMIEYSGAVRDKISNNIKCGIECDPRQNSNNSDLYIRSGSVPVNQDIKTYDLAKFQIGLFGVPTNYLAGTQLGLLWADYKVVLRKPRLYSSLGKSILFDTFLSNGIGTGRDPLSITPDKAVNNSIGGKWIISADVPSPATVSRYVFPDDFSGTVQVKFYVTGNSMDADALNLVPAGNVIPAFGMTTDVGAGVIGNAVNAITSSNTDNDFRGIYMATYTVTVTNVADSNYIEAQWLSFISIATANFTVNQINPASLMPVTNAIAYDA
jgi:hypothetical protein